MLMDSYSRVIDYLRISVTDRCNLRCIYCMPPEGIDFLPHDEIMGYEEIIRVASLALSLGFRKIRLTGGEPLVRKDFHFLVRELCHLSGLEDLSLTTNGILLAEYAETLKEAGLGRVNISLDSLDPERYRAITRGGDLNRVWASILAALSVGLSPVKINVVVLEEINLDEVLSFAELTLNWPLEVRFIEWMPLGEKVDWNMRDFIPSERIVTGIRKHFSLECSKSRNGNGPAEVYRVPGSKGNIGIIGSMTQHICAKCNRLRLTADGKLRSCLFSDEEIDLKPILRSGAEDDLVRGKLQEAIENKPESHHLMIKDRRIKKCIRTMNRIGG